MRTNLMPAPGDYKTPIMSVAQITATESPEHIQILFAAERQSGQTAETLTILVPVHVLDAAGLLRSLRMLQERGLIPTVSEPSPKAN